MSMMSATQKNGGNEIHEKYQKLISEFEELKSRFQAVEQERDQQNELLKSKQQLIDELHAEQARLKVLIENAPVGIVMTNEQGNFLLTNREADATVGGKVTGNVYSPQGGYSLHYPDGSLIPSEELPMVQALEKEEVIQDYEMVVRCEDGQETYLLVNAAPIKNDQPEIYGSIGILKDITARKKVEAELERLLSENQRQRIFLEKLIQEAPVAISVLSGPEHRYVLENPIQKHLIRGKGEIIGRTVAEVWPEGAEQVIPILDRVYRTGEAFHANGIPFYMVRDEGPETAYFNVSYTPLLDEQGQVEGILALAVETTEQEQAEQALRESEQNLMLELEAVQCLQQVSTLLIHADNIEALYDQILAAAVAVLQADFASLQMLDPESGNGGELLLLGYRGFTDQAARFWEKVSPASQSTCGVALRTGQRVFVPDVRRCDFMAGSKDLEVYLQTGIIAVQTTPLFSRSGVLLGMISTHWSKPHEPTQSDLHVLDILARLAADFIERKQVENALRESEEQIREMLESINVSFFALDREWRILYANRQFGEYLQRRPEELIGKNFWEEFPHYLGTAAEQYFHQAMEERTPVQFEAGGIYTQNWWEMTIYPTKNGISLFGIDRTGKHRAEEALRQSEERFRLMGEALPYGVWMCDKDGRAIYSSQSFLDLLEMTMEEMQGFGWTHRLPPDEVEPMLERWMHCVRTGEDWDNEHHVLGPDGKYHTVLTRGRPVRDEKGNITSWVGINLDIDERKQMEESLRLSERRLHKLVDANIIGIMYRTEDGKVLDANDAFLDIIGYSRQELEEGRINAREITPEEYRHLDEEALAGAHKTGACPPYEKEYIHKDGRRVPVLIGFAKLDPSEQSFVAFVLDLSHLKRTEAALQEYAQKLEQSNRELENFAYAASHDLQEPLRKITAFGKRIVEKMPESLDEEGKDFLTRMVDASRRMQEMIDGLLDLSRVNTHGRAFIPVDLHEIALTVVSDLESRIEAAGGKVVVDNLPCIHADPVQMQQLLQNLVGNAIKYHKPGQAPIVKVSSVFLPGGKERDQRVQIRVEDNGIGFDTRHLERIFQPFQRLVGHSEFEGSGMGLAICKKIVERHNGTITARSIPGKGSTFIVTLPYRT